MDFTKEKRKGQNNRQTVGAREKEMKKGMNKGIKNGKMNN